MSHTEGPAEHRPKETSRLDIFSDGVFAIAITLLVLELIQMLHPQSDEGLFKYFLHHWEPFLAFLIGFLTVLVCWVNHSHVFSYINRMDSKLPWINGLVLFMVTFTPFPTAILAEYLQTEGRFAIAIFGFNYFMMALASYWLCAYAWKKQLLDDDDRPFFRYIKLTYGYSVIYTLLAFLVCFISIPVALGLYLLLFFVFAFPREFATRLSKRKPKKIKKPEVEQEA